MAGCRIGPRDPLVPSDGLAWSGAASATIPLARPKRGSKKGALLSLPAVEFNVVKLHPGVLTVSHETKVYANGSDARWR